MKLGVGMVHAESGFSYGMTVYMCRHVLQLLLKGLFHGQIALTHPQNWLQFFFGEEVIDLYKSSVKELL